MHERYFFLADVLSLALAATERNRASCKIACLVQVGSMAGILAFATGVAGLAALGGVLMIGATALTARPLFAGPANDNAPRAPARRLALSYPNA